MSAVPIKVSEVLAYLKAGKTRAEIAEIYSLNGVQLKELFKHPKLKNKKTVKEKGVAFTLIDDVEDEVKKPAVESAKVEETTAQIQPTEEAVSETVAEQAAETQETAAPVESEAASEPEAERSLWDNEE